MGSRESFLSLLPNPAQSRELLPGGTLSTTAAKLPTGLHPCGPQLLPGLPEPKHRAGINWAQMLKQARDRMRKNFQELKPKALAQAKAAIADHGAWMVGGRGGGVCVVAKSLVWWPEGQAGCGPELTCPCSEPTSRSAC